MMQDRMLTEILAAHADHLARGEDVEQEYLSLFADYGEELAPLLTLARQVKDVLVRVEPSQAFRVRLGQELRAESRKRLAGSLCRENVVWNRPWVIGAAVAGSLISVASAVGVMAHRKRAKAAGQPAAG